MEADFVKTIILSLITAALSLPIVNSLLERWAVNRSRWRYPDMGELRKLITDEKIEGDLHGLLVERYQAEAFHIATGVKLKTIDEMQMLFDVKRKFSPKFGWESIRKIYPEHLHPSGEGSLELRITGKQIFEHVMLNIFGMWLFLMFGLVLLAHVKSERAFFIAFGLGIVLLSPILFCVMRLDIPYMIAKAMKKYQESESRKLKDGSQTKDTSLTTITS